ncbi:hypothetical protein [Caballeronia humi]|uniref:hypothetical protein n=1 Tax=Caballeronia humi TaxID=326474 RepID=UPI001F45E02E|nr:hypothetical protein [Caballeronia humi]
MIVSGSWKVKARDSGLYAAMRQGIALKERYGLMERKVVDAAAHNDNVSAN